MQFNVIFKIRNTYGQKTGHQIYLCTIHNFQSLGQENNFRITECWIPVCYICCFEIRINHLFKTILQEKHCDALEDG